MKLLSANFELELIMLFFVFILLSSLHRTVLLARVDKLKTPILIYSNIYLYIYYNICTVYISWNPQDRNPILNYLNSKYNLYMNVKNNNSLYYNNFIYKIIKNNFVSKKKIKVVCHVKLSTSKSKILHHSTKNYNSSCFIHIGTNIQHATAKFSKI